VVYNTAPAAGGTDHDGGGIIENSILYFNSPTDHNGAPAAGHFAFCCTTPDPGGTGNVTNDPAFASAANARLTAGSACVDGGTNLPGLLPDRDGVPRPLDGDHDGDSVCDIGAYEFIHGAADSDRDGQRDADEIVAGTSPTNAAERFAIDRVFTGSSPAEAWQVAWGTVSGRLYTVLTSTNLLAEWSPAATPGWIDVPGGSAPLWFTNAEPDSPTRFFQIKAVRP
jgi:hypothetical protein